MDILTGYNFDKFSYFRIKHLFNLESHCPLIMLQALHSLYCLYVYTFPNNGNLLSYLPRVNHKYTFLCYERWKTWTIAVCYGNLNLRVLSSKYQQQAYFPSWHYISVPSVLEFSMPLTCLVNFTPPKYICCNYFH